jgi:Cytidylate kinase-like family
MTLVALSASYGAGGSVVGPAVARRLDVPFVDRAIPLAVADRLRVPYDDAAAHDEHVSIGWLQRVLSGFVGGDAGAPAALPADTFSSEDFRRATEEVLLQQAATGHGVILGRGGVVVLRSEPRVLRVRLDGPPDRRARQAMQLGRVGPEVAERARVQFDRTHDAYMRQFYGVDVNDPALYHLLIDSTSIELDACAELIVRAAESMRLAPVDPSLSGAAR